MQCASEASAGTQNHYIHILYSRAVGNETNLNKLWPSVVFFSKQGRRTAPLRGTLTTHV